MPDGRVTADAVMGFTSISGKGSISARKFHARPHFNLATFEDDMRTIMVSVRRWPSGHLDK